MSDTQIPQSPPTEQGLSGPPPVNGSNGLATAGFVLGLLGLLASWIPVLNIVGLILGVLGAILAAVGLAKSKKVGTGKGLALSGLILGVLAVVIAIVVNVAFVNAVDEAVKTTVDTSVKVPAASSGAAAADKELGVSREACSHRIRDQGRRLDGHHQLGQDRRQGLAGAEASGRQETSGRQSDRYLQR